MKKSFNQLKKRKQTNTFAQQFATVLSILLMAGLSLSAQTDFRPGYVIRATGDTLFGEVDYRGEKRMSEICKFRPDDKGAITTFLPGEILGYRFFNSKYYVSRNINGKDVFLEYLVNGKLSIYYLNKISSDHYYIQKDGGELIELPYQETKELIDGKEYFRQSTKHIGVLTYYMNDAKSILPEIKEMKQPLHENLIRLAQHYHRAVCDGEKCIVYEKKLFPFKLNPEIIGGFARINTNENSLLLPDIYTGEPSDFSGFRPVSGVLAHIWMPRESENLYFKTGLIYLLGDKSKVMIYKIPLQLEYLYPRGRIRPRLSVGCDWLIFQPACSAGLNILLNKHLSLSASYDLNFYSEEATHLPDRILSQSFYAGLYLTL